MVVEVRTRERVRFRIVWNDDASVGTREVLLYPYGHRMMVEWTADGLSPEEIATRLNEQRVVTTMKQRHELWRRVWQVMMQRLGAAPLWLSMAGMGVSWLHVRLDLSPKYYGFPDYRARPMP